MTLEKLRYAIYFVPFHQQNAWNRLFPWCALGESKVWITYWWLHLSHFANEISKEPATHLNGKLSCSWLIMLVTMATQISSHVKDKNSIFSARDEDMINSRGVKGLSPLGNLKYGVVLRLHALHFEGHFECLFVFFLLLLLFFFFCDNLLSYPVPGHSWPIGAIL